MAIIPKRKRVLFIDVSDLHFAIQLLEKWKKGGNLQDQKQGRYNWVGWGEPEGEIEWMIWHNPTQITIRQL